MVTEVWVRTDHYGDVELFATRELAEEYRGVPIHPRYPIRKQEVAGTTSSYELQRARDIHERHVNLLKGCPLCELEAAHQRDRLACDICGEPIDPSQPFDGHADCESQR